MGIAPDSSLDFALFYLRIATGHWRPYLATAVFLHHNSFTIWNRYSRHRQTDG